MKKLTCEQVERVVRGAVAQFDAIRQDNPALALPENYLCDCPGKGKSAPSSHAPNCPSAIQKGVS